MEFRRRDKVVLVTIWVGVFILTVVVGSFIADDDPSTSDGAAFAPFMLIAGAIPTGLYILVRERKDRARKRLEISSSAEAAAPSTQTAAPYTPARFRDHWRRLALAAGVWVVGTAVLVPALGVGSLSVLLGGLLSVGVLFVLHRRDEGK